MLDVVPYLEIHEQEEDGSLRLQLTGELDLGSAPVLANRLQQLRAQEHPVRLDLSRLDFMDSTGIHLLISELKQASVDGWKFALDPVLSPQVRHLFELTGVEHLMQDAD